MPSKRGCPLFKGADVMVEEMCIRCGHFNKDTTACEHGLNLRLVKLGHMMPAEFDKKHEMMGVS